MMICLVPVRMKAILRIWIKTSTMRVVMTVTAIGQMQTVKVRTFFIVITTRREKVEKKRNQAIVYGLQTCLGSHEKRKRT